MKIISRIKENAEKGTLQIDTEKEKKILENISNMESRGLLPTLKKDYNELQEKIKVLEENIKSSDLQKTKSEYEKELKDLTAKITDSDASIKNLELNVIKMNEKKSEMLKNVEEATRKALNENIAIKL
jgi:triphosphoribosyl-dephospho-CoA synthetase